VLAGRGRDVAARSVTSMALFKASELLPSRARGTAAAGDHSHAREPARRGTRWRTWRRRKI
jgi:hypothetical protein